MPFARLGIHYGLKAKATAISQTVTSIFEVAFVSANKFFGDNALDEME